MTDRFIDTFYWLSEWYDDKPSILRFILAVIATIGLGSCCIFGVILVIAAFLFSGPIIFLVCLCLFPIALIYILITRRRKK
ncbi:MAG: hypothetical protein ACFFCW_01930 [Candidatus Hodarchaeota archaeon]